MNILESQFTDLDQLANSPLPDSVDYNINMNGRQSSSAESPAAQGGTKRKADGDGANANPDGVTHTRAKRNRYISIACNECKRRKIKCNGNTPCQRCGNLNLECQYAPNCCTNGFKESEEFRQMNAKLSSLQEQVDNLYANLNAMRHEHTIHSEEQLAFPHGSERSMSIPQLPGSTQPISPTSRRRSQSRYQSFRGPTSSTFSLDVAKNTLHSMGYQGLSDGNVTQDPTPAASPPSQPLGLLHANGQPPTRDPIWVLSKDEVVRLCRVYEEEMGIMYPMLNIEELIIHGKNMYTFIDAALRTGLAKTTSPQGIHDIQTSILKMVLAVSLVVEGGGESELGFRLFESVRKIADRILHSEVFEITQLPLLVLVAIFHFHCDEEALAWRLIGQVARMCIELGLHRRDSLFKVAKDEQQRSEAIRLFWSIYVLDRRWSFGTGMPFALQDLDIDPNLPEPKIDSGYLNAMIAYSRIGSKVWRSISSFTSSLNPTLNIEEIGYLDYQVLQWQKSIPLELQLPAAGSLSPLPSSRAVHRLQIILYLRVNQMRTHIYRPVLHSANSIQENLSHATIVVELAKDTIRALTHLNQTTDIYRAQQVCFNYFLTSALAVIFLASCHAPVHFSALCRDEFYMALDLVKGFSTKSWVSKRLWKTIKGLKEVGPRLGLSPDSSNINGNMEDPHSSAALVMAGLAGHEISGLENYGQVGNGISGSSPMNGYQMSNEMTNLFEMALGSVGINGNGTNGSYAPLQDSDGMNGIGSNIFGGDEELYRQLRDLF